MKRYPWKRLAALAMSLALAASLLAGCGGGEGEKPSAQPSGGGEQQGF